MHEHLVSLLICCICIWYTICVDPNFQLLYLALLMTFWNPIIDSDYTCCKLLCFCMLVGKFIVLLFL